MTHFTVQCGYAGYFANTVTVEADTLEEALQKAIATANDDPNWKSVDHCSPTHVDSVCEGRDADPWDRDATLPIPDRFSEHGEPPLVTLTGARPPGGVEVKGGTVRIRFVEDGGTVTTEVSDPPPPPGNKPLVTIERGPGGSPHVTVAGGNAKIRLVGWSRAAGPEHDG